MSLHVESRIQFRSDLYEKRNKTEWYSEVGKELEKRRSSITVAPGVVISNAAQLQAFMKRYASDKAGLQAAIALPPGTTLANYVQDLVQALDDTVKPTSVVTDKMIDGPVSEFGKLLGLDTSKRYAGTNTAIGQASADAVFNVGGVEVSRTATGVDLRLASCSSTARPSAACPAIRGAATVSSWSRSAVSPESPGRRWMPPCSRNGAGRTVYQRLRKPEACEAYTVGYGGVGLDDMRWDSAAHRQREANKFVSLTVEGGRYEAPAAGQPREITLGTDKMDDTYYDTKDFALMKADFQVRGRARWDTDTQIRRLLVGVKSNTVIDEFGLKRSGKVDVRNDGASAEEIKNLDHDVRVGATTWNGSTSPIAPLKGVYDAVKKFAAQHRPARRRAAARTQGAPALGAQPLPPERDQPRELADLLQADHWQARLGVGAGHRRASHRDRRRQAGRRRAGQQGHRAQERQRHCHPGRGQAQGARPGDDRHRRQHQALHAFDRRLVEPAPQSRRHPGQEAGGRRRHRRRLPPVRPPGRRPPHHRRGARPRAGKPPALLPGVPQGEPPRPAEQEHLRPLLAQLDATLARPEADQLAALKAFNDFGEKQKTDGVRAFRDFTPIADLAGFKALRAQLLNEVVRVNQRQLEAGGSAAQGLWFDEARQFYVPSSYRNTGNFLIDTMDMTQYVTHADWESIAADQRTPANELPADKVFHTSLVNETQIELGIEEPYLNRLTELENMIHGDRASLVMKFFDASGTAGIDRTKPETYAAALKTMLGKSSAEVADELAKLNDFLKAQNSAYPRHRQRPELHQARAVHPRCPRRRGAHHATLEKNLEGAKFVFQQYIDIQKAVVGSKGGPRPADLERRGPEQPGLAADRGQQGQHRPEDGQGRRAYT